MAKRSIEKHHSHRLSLQLLAKESLVATLTIIIFVPLISFFPLKFELAKPIKQEFLDFDIYDLKFSGKHLERLTRDTNIVLIEIGESRKAIADQIATIDSLGPSVIGMDVLFGTGGEDDSNDHLERVINSTTSPIVFASKINVEPEKAELTRCYFKESIVSFKDGYGNFIGDNFSIVRSWAPFARVDGQNYPSFATKILEHGSPASYESLTRRSKDLELINFTGNLENYTSFSYGEMYYYLKSGQLDAMIKNKIVLFGFFKKTPPLILEDLHFTPVNEKITGKSFPDMYGLIIHANILSMLIDKRYLRQLPVFASYVIAAVTTFCLMLFVIAEHYKRHHPSHLKLLLFQIMMVILLIYCFLLVFTYFNTKILLLPVILSLVLAVEMFNLYKSIAKWLNKKYNYTTIFSSQ